MSWGQRVQWDFFAYLNVWDYLDDLLSIGFSWKEMKDDYHNEVWDKFFKQIIGILLNEWNLQFRTWSCE